MKPKVRKNGGLLRVAALGSLIALASFVCGRYLGEHLPTGLLAGMLKYAIGAVGIVWLFSLSVYNKLSDATDIAGLDYRQHRNLEAVIGVRLQWFWLRAFYLAVLGLLLALPSVVNEAKLQVPSWVFGLSVAALALAVFSLRGIWNELEEIRQLRSHIKELERREMERQYLLKGAKDSLKDNWVADSRLDGHRQEVDLPD